jgi:hypothetical protein
MLKVRTFLPLSIVLFSLACGVLGQSIPGTQTPIPTLSSLAANTSSAGVTTITPSPIITTTFTLTATTTPTSVPTSAPSATIDPQSATLEAMMGSLSAISNISQYMHPVGTPLPNWRSVPIMSQATAGQEFPGNVYSYTAAATLDKARLYYEGKSQSLGFVMAPGIGSAGAGSNAQHDVSFISFILTIYLTSFDNDTGHVIVVISKLP